MIKNPIISVLMPVFNCDLYIREAVDSILSQTFTDFEFIIIDDCSTDQTVNIIKSYQDSRISLILKTENSGYTNSLNYGLKIAKGKYIARMDGDDVSLPKRFEIQVELLDNNLDYVVCGSQYQVIGTNKYSNHPLNHDDVKVKLLSGCIIAHPTVMFRKSFFDKNKLLYNFNKEPAEDYELWSRVVFLGKIVNLPDVLLNYRIHSNQTSKIRRNKQKEIADDIKFQMLKNLDNTKIFNYSEISTNFDELLQKQKYLDYLLKVNSNKKTFNCKLFYDFVQLEKKRNDKYFFKNYIQISQYLFFQILLFRPKFFFSVGFKLSLKLLLNCLLNKKIWNA